MIGLPISSASRTDTVIDSAHYRPNFKVFLLSSCAQRVPSIKVHGMDENTKARWILVSNVTSLLCQLILAILGLANFRTAILRLGISTPLEVSPSPDCHGYGRPDFGDTALKFVNDRFHVI